MFVAGGVFEAFGREARTLPDVAADTGVDVEVLGRMVRALASRGVFTETDGGAYELTALGRRFLRDEPGSVSGIGNFKPWELHAWAEAHHSLRTGEASFPKYYTLGFWEWLAAHPEQSEWFNEDMRRRTTTLLDGGLALYDWPHEGLVVDIGGGNGLMLERILRERPGLQGVLFDQPHVVAEARSHFEGAGVADRAEAVGGDFFFEVPSGGDIYLITSVLHDWPDDDAVRILETVRRAMSESSRLVLFEAVIVPGGADGPRPDARPAHAGAVRRQGTHAGGLGGTARPRRLHARADHPDARSLLDRINPKRLATVAAQHSLPRRPS